MASMAIIVYGVGGASTRWK